MCPSIQGPPTAVSGSLPQPPPGALLSSQPFGALIWSVGVRPRTEDTHTHPKEPGLPPGPSSCLASHGCRPRRWQVRAVPRLSSLPAAMPWLPQAPQASGHGRPGAGWHHPTHAPQVPRATWGPRVGRLPWGPSLRHHPSDPGSSGSTRGLRLSREAWAALCPRPPDVRLLCTLDPRTPGPRADLRPGTPDPGLLCVPDPETPGCTAH